MVLGVDMRQRSGGILDSRLDMSISKAGSYVSGEDAKRAGAGAL